MGREKQLGKTHKVELGFYNDLCLSPISVTILGPKERPSFSLQPLLAKQRYTQTRSPICQLCPTTTPPTMNEWMNGIAIFVCFFALIFVSRHHIYIFNGRQCFQPDKLIINNKILYSNI